MGSSGGKISRRQSRSSRGASGSSGHRVVFDGETVSASKILQAIETEGACWRCAKLFKGNMFNLVRENSVEWRDTGKFYGWP